jgi:hypothetical protein
MKKLGLPVSRIGTFAAVAALLVIGARAQSVITNNDIYRAPNSATWMKLSGSELKPVATLKTKGWGLGGGFFGTAAQAVVQVGSNVCVFIADPGSDDIAAFNGTMYVGNYIDPAGSGAYDGIALAVHGDQLYAGYSASVNIGVWSIKPDCALVLASSAANTPSWAPIDDLAVSPNGKTLVVTYGEHDIDSFAILGTKLKEKGPFPSAGNTAGIDITSDSKYAIVADFSANQTQVEVFPLNWNSSLGPTDDYVVPQGGSNSNNVWLSPDETLLFVSNSNSAQITTLRFDEKAGAQHRLSFDCLTSLNTAGGSFYALGMATEETTGRGGFLYVAQAGRNGGPSGIALLQIPQDGCPAEVSGSPFINSAGMWPVTLTAYPPRPF